jgi:glyoxylase-like metal-dependent hydrolase (beta-lactamase superfamily II)
MTVSVALHGQAPASQLQVLPVRGNLYMLVGAGPNITLSVGREGVFVVDPGPADRAEQVLAAIQHLSRAVNVSQTAVPSCAGRGCAGITFEQILASAAPAPPRPIQFLANTSSDPDHVGALARLAAAGTTFAGGPGFNEVSGARAAALQQATSYAHENVLTRLSDAGAASASLPTESYLTDLKQYFNGEGIHMIHVPAAHTDGDSLVLFRGSDVIAAGDLFVTDRYPEIDVARGGTIDGYIAGLNRLLDLIIPEYQTEGGTMVVPGHGRLSDAADVGTYRDMVTIIRNRVKDMVDRRMTLEQVKAARPTKDYDPRYDMPAWTKDQFVEAVYTSLAASHAEGHR